MGYEDLPRDRRETAEEASKRIRRLEAEAVQRTVEEVPDETETDDDPQDAA